MKLIVIEYENGNCEEFQDVSFIDLINMFANSDVNFYLERYDDLGLGYTFKGKAFIGNSKTRLCMNHYWAAYEELF